MRLIPIECIKADSILARTLYNNNSRVLLKEGATVTKSILKKIKDLQIYSLYIHDEYSDKEITDVISPELKVIKSADKSLLNSTIDLSEKLSFVIKEIIYEIT